MNIDAAFHTYHRALIYFANDMVDDYAAAQDIVTDVFIRVWQKDLKDEKHLRYTLFLSVKHRCMDYLKANVHRRKAYNRYANREPDGYLILDEVIEPLRLAVLELPNHCREVVQLYLKGIPIREIAAQLNMSHKTVHSQKTRAIHLLRKLIKHHD